MMKDETGIGGLGHKLVRMPLLSTWAVMDLLILHNISTFCRFAAACVEINYWNYYWKTACRLLILLLNTMQEECGSSLHVNIKRHANVLTAPHSQTGQFIFIMNMSFSPQLREQKSLNQGDEMILLILKKIKLFFLGSLDVRKVTYIRIHFSLLQSVHELF
jgi:hypothetical protein